MYPWKSIFKLKQSSGRPIYLQIVDALTQEVSNGRIQKGDKLPGSRELATLLSINRKTVMMAYDELMAQGWIEILPAKGTFIKSDLPVVAAISLSSKKAYPASSSKSPKVSFDQIINDGTPDYRLAPIDKLYKQARFISKGAIGKRTLLGDHLLGENHLRDTLCNYLRNSRGIVGSPENIMITRGSQMSIYLTLAYLLTKGDRVIVGKLNYHSANETIESLGGVLVKASVTDEGLDIDEIEQYLKKKRIKAIYLTPHHHYPTTVTMPPANRLKLLELANLHDFYILEDDYDYDYHYNRSPVLPMASIDRENRVIYIGSFSKLLAPSIRIGYMFASVEIISACAKTRMLIDRRGDPVLERALSDLILENEISRSLKKTVNIYQGRRDKMSEILKNELSDIAQFKLPEGGMAIWMALHDISISELIQSASKKNLSLLLDTYHLKDHCRLGFASMNDKEMDDNMEVFISCVRRMLGK